MTTGDVDVDATTGELTRLLTAIARGSLLDHHVADLASILAKSLAAAAANVGGPECLSGRPGSWEATCLRDLLLGAMGECPHQWWMLMTEPVTVSLNVAELIEDSDLHPGLIGLYEAEDRLYATLDDHFGGDQDGPEYDAALSKLHQRYADGYALYAQRFIATVHVVATDLNLPLPPRVISDDDPASAWWEDTAIRNSVDSDSGLVNELWQRAHAIVPLPDVDIRIDDTHGPNNERGHVLSAAEPQTAERG